MISPSLDHLPFMLDGADCQRHNRAADSALRHSRSSPRLAHSPISIVSGGGESHHARRRYPGRQCVPDAAGAPSDAALLDEQIAFARDVVSAANARYASGTAPQSDVLRAEVEVARFEAIARALAGEVRGAEAMLNTSLALDADTPVPPLATLTVSKLCRHGPRSKRLDVPTRAGRGSSRNRARRSRGASHARHVPTDGDDSHRAVLHDGRRSRLDGDGWRESADLARQVKAGVAEAEAMRAMSEADLRAMTRMIEGDAAVAISQLQAARDRQVALTTDVLPRARMAIEPAVAGYAVGSASAGQRHRSDSGALAGPVRSHRRRYATRFCLGATASRPWIVRGDRPMTPSTTLRRIGAPPRISDRDRARASPLDCGSSTRDPDGRSTDPLPHRGRRAWPA